MKAVYTAKHLDKIRENAREKFGKVCEKFFIAVIEGKSAKIIAELEAKKEEAEVEYNATVAKLEY